MENFLSQFANTDTKVQSSNAKLNVSPEFYGTIDVSKGSLSMTIHFYARMYKTKYETLVSLDDWDINETTDIKFNGVPIDSLAMLKQSMINSGLSTLASSLNIDNDDIAKQISIQIQGTNEFKTIFGDNAAMSNTLSEEEQNKIKLKFAIDNYDNKPLANYELGLFASTNEEGEKVPATYGELVEMYNNLNQ
jgi:hypothetical protein